MRVGTLLYSVLFLVAILGVVFVYGKFRSRNILTFYFGMSGITLFFDYLIYVIGKAYIYHPGFMQGKFDTHIGAVINAHILPSTAVLFAAFNGGWRASVLLAALFAGIELFFITINVYEPKWWNVGYTFILLCIYFPIARRLFNMLHRPYGKIFPLVSLLAIVYSVHIPMDIVIYGVLKSRSYYVPWLESLQIDSAAFNTIVTLSVGIAFAALIRFHVSKVWYVVVIMTSFMADLICKQYGLVQAHSPWDSLYYVAADTLSLFVVVYLGQGLQK